jgi:glycosyltransferase involved in cell wall biosynthesis
LTTEHCLAVLGCRDQPTDAVESYCEYLAQALSKRGFDLKLARLPWAEQGWAGALRELQKKIHEHEAKWVLVQYTALAWSRRGFPMRFTRILRAIKNSGARCAVVFHDPALYPRGRLIDAMRRAVQLRVMRKIVGIADLSIFTVPKETIDWLPKKTGIVLFIPVGANLPDPERVWGAERKDQPDIPRIAVFCVNGGAAGDREISRIAQALRMVANEITPVRLDVLGRNSESAGPKLSQQLAASHVEVVVHGLVEAKEVERILGESDVMLFVRGPVSTRRGSALAGIACGLPVVAYEGWETAGPIKEAGVELVSGDGESGPGQALVRVLRDEAYRKKLQERSKRAQNEFFSWEAIAEAYVRALRG